MKRLSRTSVESARAIEVPTLVIFGEEMDAETYSQVSDAAGAIPGAILRGFAGNAQSAFSGSPDSRADAILQFLSEDVETAGESSESGAAAFQTIMFTDLESSTALTQRLGDQAAQEVLHGHNDAVRKSLQDNGGREVKHTGANIRPL